MTASASTLLLAAAAAFAASVAYAQSNAPATPQWSWPERMQNAEILPSTTTAEQLRVQMLRFTAALGVRCSHCHVGVEGRPLSTYDFASDAKPQKDIARAMMRMTFRLNTEELPAIAELPKRPAGTRRVTCYTCHRGATTPVSEPPPGAPASPVDAGLATERG